MRRFLLDLLRQVALIYHGVVLVLVGLVGRILLVEQLLLVAVEQLLNPILLSNRDVARSLVVVEVRCMLSHIRLLQSSIGQLLEQNKLEVFLEG